MTEENKKIESLITAGADIAGAAVGGALGFIAGGPVTAAGAGVFGVGVTRVLRDVATRFLSNRETVRIGATAALAISSIKERLASGEQLRSDDFFDEQGSRPSAAEEIFEGVLLKSKNTHEEKKAYYLGGFFSNVVFDETCMKNEANYHLHVAESLTYTQFVLLHLFSGNVKDIDLRKNTYMAGEKIHYASISLLHSIHELCDLNLLIMKSNQDAHNYIVLGINQICPSNLALAVGGDRLYKLLGLDTISREDVEEIAQWLR